MQNEINYQFLMDHENIVKLESVHEVPNHYILKMEYFEGISLTRWAETFGPMDET